MPVTYSVPAKTVLQAASFSGPEGLVIAAPISPDKVLIAGVQHSLAGFFVVDGFLDAEVHIVLNDKGKKQLAHKKKCPEGSLLVWGYDAPLSLLKPGAEDPEPAEFYFVDHESWEDLSGEAQRVVESWRKLLDLIVLNPAGLAFVEPKVTNAPGMWFTISSEYLRPFLDLGPELEFYPGPISDSRPDGGSPAARGIYIIVTELRGSFFGMVAPLVVTDDAPRTFPDLSGIQVQNYEDI